MGQGNEHDQDGQDEQARKLPQTQTPSSAICMVNESVRALSENPSQEHRGFPRGLRAHTIRMRRVYAGACRLSMTSDRHRQGTPTSPSRAERAGPTGRKASPATTVASRKMRTGL